MYLEIIETTEDQLADTVWRFWYDEHKHELILNEWAERQRPSKRHGWNTTSYFSKIDKRKNTGEKPSEIPDSVKNSLTKKFLETLKVSA